MFTPIKELGQNFLIDEEVIERMVGYLDLNDSDIVVEVGPGLGALTKELSERLIADPSEIYAVEIDKRFVEKLKNMFSENMNVDVIEGNILDWLPTFYSTKPFKLLGSLPYYITSPIIHEIINMRRRPDLCVILIQKEVADRIASKAPDGSYMSVFVQTFYDTQIVEEVNRAKFDPAPSVDGAILKLRANTNFSINDVSKYEGFLHRGFSNPRKMLNKIFTKEELDAVNVSGNLRAQDLEVAKWVEMFNTLVKN